LTFINHFTHTPPLLLYIVQSASLGHGPGERVAVHVAVSRSATLAPGGEKKSDDGVLERPDV
jgi:hypothetical protein